MSKPRLLDLFCGAGGAAMGYHRAGFEVVGVDVEKQPSYPFEFVEDDALDVLDDLVAGRARGWGELRAIHTSPPCQEYSSVSRRAKTEQQKTYPDLVGPVRDRLLALGLPYVLENVEGAPILKGNAVRLCGSSFGLDVRRHRWFESSLPLLAPPCNHASQRPRFRSLDSRQKTLATVVGVHGHLNYPGEAELRNAAMGIDWMTQVELAQAIPPAYTEFIGSQLIDQLARVA